MKPALILAGILGLATNAAPAQNPQTGNPNPVVDLTGRVDPGFWQNETVTTVNGKRQAPKASNDCITARSLRNFLNQDGSTSIRVSRYFLHGNHLHIKARDTLYAMEIEEDVYFDTPDHMRAVISVRRSGNGGPVVRTRFVAQRIAATCPKPLR